MQYQQAKHLKPAEFKRFWGVKLETFMPGKKSLYQSEPVIKIVVIDVIESPIERPKKNRNNFIAARRKSIPLSHKL